jgi:hypothetical protein
MGKTGNCWRSTDTVGAIDEAWFVEIHTDTVSPSFGALGLSIACNASALPTVKIMEAIAVNKPRQTSKGSLKDDLKESLEGRRNIDISGRALCLDHKAKALIIL